MRGGRDVVAQGGVGALRLEVEQKFNVAADNEPTRRKPEFGDEPDKWMLESEAFMSSPSQEVAGQVANIWAIAVRGGDRFRDISEFASNVAISQVDLGGAAGLLGDRNGVPVLHDARVAGAPVHERAADEPSRRRPARSVVLMAPFNFHPCEIAMI